MESKFGKRSVFTSIVWKLLERGASVAVTLLVNIVLARLLPPEDFGLLAMITVFVALSTIFVTAGLSGSLIQKKDSDETDFSTIFWLNLIVSICIYLLLFVSAPFIAAFYGYPQLTLILRVLSVNILIAAFNSVQCAYIAKNMLFKNYFFSTLTGKIGSGIIGVSLALAGCGVWALVFQSISLYLLETTVLWFRVGWRPKRIFSLDRAKALYSFAWKVMLMSFVESIRDQLRNLVIGKKYSPADLAFYDKGALFPNSIVTNISTSLNSVMFPVLSDAQDDTDKRNSILRRWTSLYAYCTFPILVGLAVVAQPLISVLLTDKWLPSVPYLQITCGVYAVWVIELPIRETIKSLGYAGICLKMQIIKTVFALVVVFFLMNYGVMAIALGTLGCGAFNIAVSLFYGSKYIGYYPKMIFADLYPALLLSALMGICAYCVTWLGMNNLVTLVLQVAVGLLVYIGASCLLKVNSFTYLLQTIKSILRKHE